MAFLTTRTSSGKKYWSIVESRRINGKPRQVILKYLGSADGLLKNLRDADECSIKTYSHGDSAALLQVAVELDVIGIINMHIPTGPNGAKPVRNGLTVGASILLAAIGRACHPTSKRGWYDWCKTTSLEYCLRSSYENLDSGHFWDEMDFIPEEKIPEIEADIVGKLVEKYQIEMDTLLYDTSNFFTFIDSTNSRCALPNRGRNKQKRNDLRQVGLALLVSKKDQFPLFHKTYEGNKNDITCFKEIFTEMTRRIKCITKDLADVTLIFDKGNNSKESFRMIDNTESFHYVGGLVPSHFKSLIKEANKNFDTMKIEDEQVPVYRVRRQIWGEERTCVVTISELLRDGQIKGIHQHLDGKYKALEEFKRQLENPKRRKKFDDAAIQERLKKIIRGQFIEDILTYDLIKLNGNSSFTYAIDTNAFEKLKEEVLGRKILVTNRHEWSNEEIILAYRGQAKVEYAFRNLKNPYHLAIRPQFHWTDQKIEVHCLICIIAYLLTIAAYTNARKKVHYRKNITHFFEDLRHIRLAFRMNKKSTKVKCQLEQMSSDQQKLAKALNISEATLRPKLSLSVYT